MGLIIGRHNKARALYAAKKPFSIEHDNGHLVEHNRAGTLHNREGWKKNNIICMPLKMRAAYFARGLILSGGVDLIGSGAHVSSVLEACSVAVSFTACS